jgi:NAD(P)-dependent dehydrogenase (short-subunit alcohol dehydrogenase family)
VTGGSRGIGKAVAAALLGAGACVVISSRKKDVLDVAVEELSAAGGGDRIAAFVANAGDSDQARDCVDASIERFGAVDILVNNAATNPHFGPLMGLDSVRAEKTVAINQFCPLLWTQLVWQRCMAGRGGSVVNDRVDRRASHRTRLRLLQRDEGGACTSHASHGQRVGSDRSSQCRGARHRED